MADLPQLKARLLGVVLCGGQSSRMGRDKSDLPHPLGGTFLTRAINRLRTVCDEVLVSTSTCPHSKVPQDVVQIHDPVNHQGPIVGVAQCLRYAANHGYQGCFVTPVDMPDLTDAELRQLRESWDPSPDRVVCAVDTGSDKFDPLVAIYPIGLGQTLQTTAGSSDRSLFRLIQRCDPILVGIASQSMRNVNRPEDL